MGAIANINLCPISQVSFTLLEEIMLKAYEVMTRALATCAPDASVAHAAAIMRDRDIGNVLVVEDGKLRGLVTDRDLALQALTGKDDPLQTPIRKFMSTQVVTGEAAWSLEQVAKIMAKHQVRRLPIVQDGQLVGIVSLGDVALHEDRRDVVTKSLQAISTPIRISVSGRSGRGGALIGFALAALATTMIAWLTWNHYGQALRKQMAKSKLYHTAQYAVSAARDKVDEAASSKLVRDLRHQMRSNLNDLSAQLPTLEYKPPKRKHIWFG
jgi:CBS domain-containing protein